MIIYFDYGQVRQKIGKANKTRQNVESKSKVPTNVCDFKI